MTPPSSRLSHLLIPAILLLLLLGMTACSPPAPAATKSAVPAHETQVADAPPTRTPTPSPTHTLTPSPTSTPTRTPTPSPTRTPTPTPILATRVYAIAAPFATIRDDIPWREIETRWADPEAPPLLVLEPETPFLQTLFDSPPAHPISPDQLRDALDQPDALAILPFDQLDPTLKVLTIDGLNPLDKRLDLADYPLALTITGPAARDLPATNRDPSRITTLIMTGVTAMSRGTAEKMEQKGVLYPALVISDTLAAADITHVSNEVPFIEGCEVNNTYMNLILCSDYDYWQALEAIGTDIVGLSGNHVNDFGREGARESIRFYRERGIPIYGSGLNEEEACQPLLWEDHGNTFAFIAALAWWPDSAWATETEPGACYFYRNYDKILATVRQLSREVDIVSVELQFQETYNPWPIESQIEEFRALREAGADIITGVQSHVPQAAEPYAHPPGIILYGLGNLFFDQMQSWETRTALIARHTIYDGRLISTELLTTVLEDFAQPRWATAKERAEILQRIFEAAPPPPGQTAKARPNQVATKPTANATPRPVAPPPPFPTERVLP
ncbi:MAG: CapA family protein, partial [Chloroflexi bacterium]|nr:CapA family protein [Chloroflexota bacterium]